MRSVTAAVAVMVLGSFVCGAAAQEIPEKTRKGLAQQLQGSFVVFRAKAQADLKLTGEQKDAIERYLKDLHPDLMEFFQKVDGLNPQEREQELKAFRPQMQEKLAAFLKETLKKDQLQRLRQLELQREGALALWHGDPQLRTDLKITDEQRKQFMAVVQDMHKKIEPLAKEVKSGGDPETIWPQMMKIRREHEARIVDLLTDAQKKQWRAMVGKTANLDE